MGDSQTEIHTARSDAEILACFAVIHELRPHLEESSFVARVRRQQAQGYTLVFIREGDAVVAAAGYRFAEFLAWGRVLYVDDLISAAEKRGRGYGGALMDWLAQRAQAEGCDELHLDSGYARHDAHRLYLNKGMRLASHHFARVLKPR
jgi:GNAT superfamily N-acetyltransferase